MQTRRRNYEKDATRDPLDDLDQETDMISITRYTVRAMEHLKSFAVTQLVADLDTRYAMRRVYDVLAILLGCGFVAIDTKRTRRYVFEGIEGTRRLHNVFVHSRDESLTCPFSEIRQLRCHAWELLKVLSTCDGALTKQWISEQFGSRRYYDLVNVMQAAGLVCVSGRGEEAEVILAGMVRVPPLNPLGPEKEDTRRRRRSRRHDVTAEESPVLRPRMVLTVSDEDALAIWSDLQETWSTNNQDLFAF